MENKIKSRLALALIFLPVLIGCGRENPVSTENTLIGQYESIEFIQPGSNDTGIDVIAEGGSLTLLLESNGLYKAVLYIPENINIFLPKGISVHEGVYSYQNGIVRLEQFFSINEFIPNHKNNTLTSKEVTARGPMRIVFSPLKNSY